MPFVGKLRIARYVNLIQVRPIDAENVRQLSYYSQRKLWLSEGA